MKYTLRPVQETANVAEYRLEVDGDTVKVAVTSSTVELAEWIRTTKNHHRRRLHRLMVGLDVQWGRDSLTGFKTHPTSLTICVHNSVLVFQLNRSHKPMPEIVTSFFLHDDFRFYCVGVDKKLMAALDKYSITLNNVQDLRQLAAQELDVAGLNYVGLMKLAKDVIGKEFRNEKVKVAKSNYDKPKLTDDEILYAAIGAKLAFKIGVRLSVWYD